MARISIALAIYNGEPYIKKQLESLIEQTRPADEVILIDDCSTDKTVEVVEQFVHEHGLSHWALYQIEKIRAIKGISIELWSMQPGIWFFCAIKTIFGTRRNSKSWNGSVKSIQKFSP